jgi:hypothetical protein
LGYGAGSGGTATQATSKSTAVTLNKSTGQITMNAASLAAGAAVNFTLNNSLFGANDTLVCVVQSATSGAQNYTVGAYVVAAGAAGIKLTNLTGGALAEAVVINFAILKGSAT